MRSSITILFVLFNILLCFVWSVEKKRKNEDFSDFDDDEFVVLLEKVEKENIEKANVEKIIKKEKVEKENAEK
jgi:hypothetical protein